MRHTWKFHWSSESPDDHDNDDDDEHDDDNDENDGHDDDNNDGVSKQMGRMMRSTMIRIWMMLMLLMMMLMLMMMMMMMMMMITSASHEDRVGKQIGRVKSEKVTGRSSCNIQ